MTLHEAAAVAQRKPDSATMDDLKRVAAKLKRVSVLKTSWYPDVLVGLTNSACRYLESVGVATQSIHIKTVPGSFELPLAAQKEFESGAEIVVALGCIIRGDTPHFDYVSRVAIDGLMQVQLKFSKPVGLGVLTVDHLEQALARHEKGSEAAQAAFWMHFNDLK